MSHSGDSQVFVEQDGQLLAYTGQELDVADGHAVIFFAVPGMRAPRCKPSSQGAILEPQEAEKERLLRLSPSLTWWSWSPWGDPRNSKTFALNRRIGLFELQLETPSATSIRAFMHSGRLLSASQGMQIVRAISQQFPSAIWSELGTSTDSLARPHAHVDPAAPSPRRQTVSLLKTIELELRAARAAAATPAWELAPRHPSRESAPGQPNRGRDYDISENRVVVAWARMRQSQLQALLWQLESAMGRLDAAFAEDLRLMRERRAARERGRDRDRDDKESESEVLDDADRLSVLRGRLLAQRPILDRIIRSLQARGIGERWSMTPAIRRNPGLALLAGVQARPFLDESCSELRDVGLALLPLRTTSRLYELWAALAIAQVLETLGFRQSDTLQVNDHDARTNLFELPHRLAWTFTRDDIRLQWHFSPSVTTLDGGLQPREAALLLTKQERSLCLAHYRQLVDTYVTGLQTNNPDYIVRVERHGRTAFAVGDAVFADPNHPSGMHSKVDKVAGEYASNIRYVDDHGNPFDCHQGSSFVLIPQAPATDAQVHQLAMKRQIVLLPLAPGPNGNPSSAATRQITQIVDTLIWLCDHPDLRPDAT